MLTFNILANELYSADTQITLAITHDIFIAVAIVAKWGHNHKLHLPIKHKQRQVSVMLRISSIEKTAVDCSVEYLLEKEMSK
jgi:hypothetical protein